MRDRGTAGACWSLLTVLVVLGEAADTAGWAGRLVSFAHLSVLYAGGVGAVTAWRLWSGRREPSPVVLTSAVLFPCVAGLVHQVRPEPGLGVLSDVLLHGLTPLFALAVWLCCHRHGGLRHLHAFAWLVCPIAYLVFVLARGVLVGRYPYSFLDVAVHGYGGALSHAVGYGAVVWLLGLLLVAVDGILGRIGSGVPGGPGRREATVSGVTTTPKR